MQLAFAFCTTESRSQTIHNKTVGAVENRSSCRALSSKIMSTFTDNTLHHRKKKIMKLMFGEDLTQTFRNPAKYHKDFHYLLDGSTVAVTTPMPGGAFI